MTGEHAADSPAPGDPSAPRGTVTVEVYLTPAQVAERLLADVSAGLGSRPLSLPPRWFYDDRGSELFDQITRLPEYYPTERERSILLRRARDIAEIVDADTVVELGSGTSDKTTTLLDAVHRRGRLRRFCPLDVSEGVLRRSGATLAERYGIDVHGVVGDFCAHLDRIPRGGRRLFVFLGSTIGNFTPPERRDFLAALAAAMEPGDGFVLGADLVKAPERLVLAYDDPGGVTAEFNRNVLNVVNRSLGADFDPSLFRHEGRWNGQHSWIEMHLVATVDHTVTVPAAGLTLHLEAGESIHTEISTKFRPRELLAELAGAGLTPRQLWTDEAGDFSLTLAER